MHLTWFDIVPTSGLSLLHYILKENLEKGLLDDPYKDLFNNLEMEVFQTFIYLITYDN